MLLRRLATWWVVAVALGLLAPGGLAAQDGDASQGQAGAGSAAPKVPVIQTTSTLVFLDVTVLDKKGQPVVSGLTKDDFTVTEDGKPERIFSFEAPEERKSTGQGPLVTLVLDFLNAGAISPSGFREDDYFGYVLGQARDYLEKQPEELSSPTALMVSGEQSLDMMVGYTRSRADLLFALDHMPRMASYKSSSTFLDDRLRQSYDALMQIAVQNKGVPGRKLVIWIGAGPSVLDTSQLSYKMGDMVDRFSHRTINLMVEDRVSLYWIRPGLVTNLGRLSKRELEGTKRKNNSDAFTDNLIRFSDYVDGTGGKTFNLNNVAVELGQSVELGSGYYTLTYQPHDEKPDGELRKIHVDVKNPELAALTKVGYFAPRSEAYAKADDSILENLTEAAMANIPFQALDLKVASVVRHPDTRTVEITLQLADRKLDWQPADNGQSSATVIATGVSRSSHDDMLGSRVAKFYLLARSQDREKLAGATPQVKLTLPYPKGTKLVRVALASDDGARIGSVSLAKKVVDAAPEAPSPVPVLARRKAAPPALSVDKGFSY